MDFRKCRPRSWGRTRPRRIRYVSASRPAVSRPRLGRLDRRGNLRPETRSSPLGGRRRRRRFARDNRWLRRRTRPSSPCRHRPIAIYRDRCRWCRCPCPCCCGRHCRGRLRLGLATKAECLSHRRSTLRISWSRERMIDPQSPPPQVIISARTVSRGDVPSQRLPPVAAVQTNHILLAHGTPDRHSRGQNLLGLNGLSNLAERPMHGSDDLGQLLRTHPMLPYVAPDDLRGENWINPFNIHDVGPVILFAPSYITRKESIKRGSGRFTTKTSRH